MHIVCELTTHKVLERRRNRAVLAVAGQVILGGAEELGGGGDCNHSRNLSAKINQAPGCLAYTSQRYLSETV